MEENNTHNGEEMQRPLGVTLLGGLYLFFFMLTVSSYGQPLPFFGAIYHGSVAGQLVFFDSLICLYLFLGLMKRQRLTWYLLLGYNAIEAVNTLTNLLAIPTADLESIVGTKVDANGLIASNISIIAALLLLSAFIFYQRRYFTNRSNYLF